MDVLIVLESGTSTDHSTTLQNSVRSTTKLHKQHSGSGKRKRTHIVNKTLIEQKEKTKPHSNMIDIYIALPVTVLVIILSLSLILFLIWTILYPLTMLQAVLVLINQSGLGPMKGSQNVECQGQVGCSLKC